MDKKLRKALLEMKKTLKEEYPDDFQKLYLFGSQVEKFNPDSDCDIAVIFRKGKDWKKRYDIMSKLLDVGILYDLVLDTCIFSVKQLNRPIYKVMPLVNNIFKLGVEIK
ncbi:MAG: nucleotidyltransferase domain-containing protein [Candidatus Eremiobacteraeota bacterium]|nr:nucleotidyltransferase domain-containing protein [Candidatus Eremiobacteraeota bacterium]